MGRRTATRVPAVGDELVRGSSTDSTRSRMLAMPTPIGVAWVELAPSSSTRRVTDPGSPRSSTDERGVRVLGGVLHRLQAGEVRRRLDRRGVPAHGGPRPRQELRWCRRRRARPRPALVAEHGGIDALEKGGQGVDRVNCGLDLAREDDVRRSGALGQGLASRRFTASATRCCWAPSMSRSSSRRSSRRSTSRSRPAQLVGASRQLGTS